MEALDARMSPEEEQVYADLGPEIASKALEICDALGSDQKGLDHICAQVLGLTDEKAAANASRQFYRWRIRSTALSRLYARACENRAHLIAHQLVSTIDSEPDPYRARIKMDALKWLAAKFNRAHFGDDTALTVQGNADKPIVHQVEHTAVLLDEIKRRLTRKRDMVDITPTPQGEGQMEGGVGGQKRDRVSPTLPANSPLPLHGSPQPLHRPSLGQLQPRTVRPVVIEHDPQPQAVRPLQRGVRRIG